MNTTTSSRSDPSSTPVWQPRAAAVHAGVARCDITPPTGIYARMWGAAEHDCAEGVHQPLTATVLAIRGNDGGEPLLLISLDWVFVTGEEELSLLRTPLLELLGGDPARLIIACTHTHAAGMMTLSRSNLPGGALIAPYLQHTAEQLRRASEQALQSSQTQPCTLTWSTGRCDLAANRDLPAADGLRDLCGFNPAAKVDDTLLVGRLTRQADDSMLATVVNYACHPTTLAWENRLLSPDYVGTMREVVESATGGAPCLFLQGASGELAPRLQYVADLAIAEGHGRQLGHAVLSTLAGMLPPRRKLVMEQVVESGAPLAVWGTAADEPSDAVSAICFQVDLPTKPMPTVEQLCAKLAGCTDRAQSERLRRQLRLVEQFRMNKAFACSVWAWRIGDALFVAQPNEAYSDLQQCLRSAFPQQAVLVMNVANGSCGYLYPRHLAGRNRYAVWQSPYTGEALDVLVNECQRHLTNLVVGPDASTRY
ncbi:hypothetical protein ACERK3_00020 [Phycisphaerales bacterium AB-hyl4]|uniref:Neutral/alkaline ceramidase-like enzyme n=1 Tax=Natronomicrosphaera hydrolytica TaxID=3242702 RepID=A0ABV4U1F4_9BACT